jgi:hypothetical protein
VFSLAFLFSLPFVPSFLFIAGIMYVCLVFLGVVHHYWAKDIVDENDATCIPKPVVEIAYIITAPYHPFGTVFNMFCYVEVANDDLRCMTFIAPVIATLVLFSISTLVASGAHVALHVYSGHNGGELIGELYRFQYDSFTHTPHLVLRIFDLDFAKALKSLPTSFDLGSLPDLGWGPENFAQLARAQNTLTLLVSLLRNAIAVVFFALQTHNFVSPSVSTLKAASGRRMSMKVHPEG